MALSGSFSGSINNGHYRLRVDWSASQNISANQSTITANMYLERDYSLYISGRTDSITTKLSMKNVEDTIENLKDLLKMKDKKSTKEIDIIIKKQVEMCKKRLDEVMKNII